jgi:hypothetical protein
MSSEVLKLTSEIVISHASMSELTPEQLVEESQLQPPKGGGLKQGPP